MLDILQRKPAIALLFTDLGLPGEMDGKTLAGSEDQGAGPSAGVFALHLMYGDRLGTFPAYLR